MFPDPQYTAKRKKFGLVTAALVGCGIAARSLAFDPNRTMWSIVGMAFVAIADAGLVFLAWPGSGRFFARPESNPFLLPVRGGRKPGPRGLTLPGHRLHDSSGPAPTPTGRWPALRAAARLMPPAAGRRWLAEAESLLFELPPNRRGPAIRSYLRSAPRLVLMMWASGLSRQTWPRSRRRG